MENSLVSIIIRTKNEEKWIGLCLNSLFNQTYKNFEVILIDNCSTDKTIEKLKNFNVALYKYDDEYRPGKSLNYGIQKSKGEFIVCLSGHCIPVNENWLEKLLSNFADPMVAGVYGRQEPLSFTPDIDKRDLINTFRVEKIVQTKDSFFHNANSMLRRSIWEKIPFDAEVTNIEDRLWGKAVIEKGFKIIYEPEASVYHYHGIHQSNNEVRCYNVVKILEENNIVKRKDTLNPKDLKVIALIPLKKDLRIQYIERLVHYTIKELNSSNLIDDIYVIADDKKIADIAEKEGAIIPFLRPKKLSKNLVNLSDVFKYALDKLEEDNIVPDLIVLSTITYPFRQKGLFEKLINEISISGMDTVVAAHPEFRMSWKNDGKDLKQINGFIPRMFKDPVLIGMLGLGCVTHPYKIRENEIFAGRVGIYEVENRLSAIEVRTNDDFKLFSKLMNQWFSNREKTN